MSIYWAPEITSLPPLLRAEKYVNGSIVLSHTNGTISVHNEDGKLSKLIINPGMAISYFHVIGDKVFVSFTSGCMKCFSLYHGIQISQSILPPLSQICCLSDRLIAVWSDVSPRKLTLLDRQWLTTSLETTTDSPIIKVLDDLLVICRGHILKFDHNLNLKHRQSINARIVDAAHHGDKLLLVYAKTWEILNQKFEVEISADAPTNSSFTHGFLTSYGAFLFTDDRKLVLIHQNNIQVADLPNSSGEFVHTSDGSVIDKATLTVYTIGIEKEAHWNPRNLQVSKISHKKYLPGQEHSKITCMHNALTGYANGKINSTQVFPTPVLKITDEYAFSRYECTRLPLSVVQKVVKADEETFDLRIFLKMKEISAFERGWVCIKIKDYILVEYLSQPTPLTALYTCKTHDELDNVLPYVDCQINKIVQLENLLMLQQMSKESTKPILELLYRIWDPARVEEHLRFRNPRSLKLMASCYPKYPPDVVKFDKMMNEKIDEATLSGSGSVNEQLMAQAVLWVYIYSPHLVKNVNLKSLMFEGQGFIEYLASKASPQLLIEALSTNKLTEQSSQLAKVLLSHNLGDMDLLKLVKIITNNRENNRSLYNHLITHEIVHLHSDLLLFRFSKYAASAGTVFDIHKFEETLLLKPNKLKFDKLEFNPDGNYVLGHVGNVVMGWKLKGGFTTMFSRHLGPLSPHIINHHSDLK